MSTSLTLRLATPEEVEAANARTPENLRYWRMQARSARAEWQNRDERGRFAPGYLPSEYEA